MTPDLFATAEYVRGRSDAGTVLGGRYVVERRLGQGGSGQVYAAQDLETGMRVAVKALHPRIAQNPLWVARLRNEVVTAWRVHHPNVARLYLDCRRGARLIVQELGRHALAANAIGRRQNFNPVTQAPNRPVGCANLACHPPQILIVTNIFRVMNL